MLEEEELLKIQEHCSFNSPCNSVQRLSGGDINDVFVVEFADFKYVVKRNVVNRFPQMMEKEYRALMTLHATRTIRYPQPISHFIFSSHQYLVMEYISSGLNSQKGQELLGKGLAQQHKETNDQFGWQEDNYIGSLPQPNNQSSSWSEFYAGQRLLFQTKLAYDHKHVDQQFVRQMESFCKHLTGLFPEEKPALLHGDLWGGNYFITKEGRPLLYDPAVYYGHREIDIAMTKLFGGFSNAFYESYMESFPLEKGWVERLKYSQLYPNLVHLNLFGGSYLSAIYSVIKRF